MTTKNLIVTYLFVFVLACTPYINNILDLADCDGNAPYTCEVIHGAGLIPPVAFITMWFGVDNNG